MVSAFGFVELLLPEEREHWDQYARLEEAGRRREALVELQEVLGALAASDPERREAVAEEMCAAWLDRLEPSERPSPLLRYPLVRDLLAPHLCSRMDTAVGERRMAILLLSGVVPARDWKRLAGDWSPVSLLERVVEAVPEDGQACRWLLDRRLKGLRYAFHELPSGVLAEPHELEADARWVERLACHAGGDAGLASAVAFTREQAAALREFRGRADRSTSYEAFMTAREVNWQNMPELLTPGFELRASS